MKILWLQTYFGTPNGWGSQRQYAMTRRWVQAGHVVEVFCSSAYDPSLVPGRTSVFDGVRLHVNGAVYSSHMGFWRRCAAFLRFMADALWFVTRQGASFDVLIVSSGPLSNLVPALWGRLLYRLPYVFEVLDVWPDAAVEAGFLRNRLLVRCAHGLEFLGYRQASKIVTCSTGMSARVYAKLCGTQQADSSQTEPYKAYLASESSLSDRIVTLAHGGELCIPDRDVCRQHLLETHGWPADACLVLYMGAMGISNAIEDVVEAMRLTRNVPNVYWVFSGSGVKEAAVCAGLDVRRGAFLGKLSYTEMQEVCVAADVNVVTFMHKPLFYENSPNKFFDGIAAGVPAVFNRSTWLEPWLKEYDCGIVCKGERPGVELAEAICLLAGDPERRKRMGRNARRLAEEVFDRDQLAATYLEVLENVLKLEEVKKRAR